MSYNNAGFECGSDAADAFFGKCLSADAEYDMAQIERAEGKIAEAMAAINEAMKHLADAGSLDGDLETHLDQILAVMVDDVKPVFGNLKSKVGDR